jgi:hypothetical protein
VQPPEQRAPRRRLPAAAVIGLLAFLAAAGVAVGGVLQSRADQTDLIDRSPFQRFELSLRPVTDATPAPPPPPAPAPAVDGHALNDQGYELLRAHRAAEAVPLLRQAVAALRGRGPSDPYEAYANYNLGLALVQTRRCAEAVGSLRLAQRLEGGATVRQALRTAERCA